MDRATVAGEIIARLLPLTESPIEVKFLENLAAEIGLETESRFAAVAKSPFRWDLPGNGELLTQPIVARPPFHNLQSRGIAICAQVSIGAFRADFAIQKVYVKSGTFRVGSTVFIECDGHKYHNLTDEQRARDLNRDAKIQEIAPVSILRFRGFEIWNRAGDCAARALDELDRLAAGYLGGPVRVVGLEQPDADDVED